ncbi:hypothetical protein THIOM_005308 [Candidatus Thiomargarita nelsonii]|uniref:Uncharacterized protein n=1 Tax=Candidatus Thiomargarita nelsonii TaxID=1003181 RepID=A0A176RTL9_9GAMM|nr:hypothetical protein THIOM_005308 [Candidatus Thiomargarita nelsonii]
MCDSLCSQVHEWLKKNPEFKITDPNQFDLLRRDITATGNEDEIVLAIAMCVLGPEKRKFGPSPDEIKPHLDDLYVLLKSEIPDKDERIRRAVEFAIAYGCGWRRDIKGKKGWDGLWLGALMAMKDLLSDKIQQACNALAYHGPGPGGVRDFQRRSDSEEIQDAPLIAMQLIRGNYQNGQPNYQRYHALSEWEPQKGNLYVFLQIAIQGSAASTEPDQSRIPRVGYFSQGMYYPILEEDGLLNKGDMEFKKCQETIPDGNLCDTEFERDKCPRCEKPFNPKISRRIKKRMLYSPKSYQYKVRYRCKKCENYFPGNFFTRKICPLAACRGNQTQGTTHLLVYEPIDGLEKDDIGSEGV